jgi:hypothetical protein
MVCKESRKQGKKDKNPPEQQKLSIYFEQLILNETSKKTSLK